MTNGSGQQIPVVIVDVKDDSVILDANHPLAAKTYIRSGTVEIIGAPSRIIMP